jgi:hypothetical protein
MASERDPLFFFDGRLLDSAKTPEQQKLMDQLIAESITLAVIRRLVADGWYESKEEGEQELRESEASIEALLKQIDAAFKDDGGQ